MHKTLAAAAAAVATAAGAATVAHAATTVPSVQIKGAYAYIEKSLGDHKTYATVVFKTAGELPRRYDGMIRASGSIDGTGYSLGAVRGRRGLAAHCYQFYAEVRDGRLRGVDGTKASIGSSHEVAVSARGTDGEVGDTTSVVLRRKRSGDRSGRPLGC